MSGHHAHEPPSRLGPAVAPQGAAALLWQHLVRTPWLRAELLCLLTTGAVLLAVPVGSLLSDALWTLRSGLTSHLPLPAQAMGRIVAIHPATVEGPFHLAGLDVDYEVCGIVLTESGIAGNHKALHVGMLVPVSYRRARRWGEEDEVYVNLYGARDPAPDEASTARCTP